MDEDMKKRQKAASSEHQDEGRKEDTGPEPYSGRERIKPASNRDVSPNTPTGEDV